MFYFISSLLLTGFWFLLSDGDITSLLVGVVFIPMSVYVS
ncbi:MAG: multicomponent Na+:H+ antiporter subunit E, partial [Colwellia sp.]